MVCGNVVTIVTKQDEITNDNNIDIKSLFAHLIPQQGEMDFIMQLFVSFTILKTRNPIFTDGIILKDCLVVTFL